MDLITHALTGVLIGTIDRHKRKVAMSATLLGATVPDIGEILIQNALAKKYGEALAVYDSRTSDPAIASDLAVTWLYDLLHSPVISVTLLCLALALLRKDRGNGLNFFGILGSRFAIGMLSHALLDSFTHGHVWALKLFFPISEKRFLVFPEAFGNWWDWQPKLELPLAGFSFPLICLIIWAVIVIGIVFSKRASIKGGG